MNHKPQMIIFDYGHTLTYENDWNRVRAITAFLKCAVSNKNNVTAEEINDLYSETAGKARLNEIDFHYYSVLNLLFEYFQIEVNLSLSEIEEIYWNNVASTHTMPNIAELLEYLQKNNIRTGVISNTRFSGEAMSNKLNKILPENNFEFIITSSDYVFRKPNKILFELALKKANLDAGEVWYCGDNAVKDVLASNSAGIFPVWFDSEIECFYRTEKQNAPDCEYLHIKDWCELIDALDSSNFTIKI